MEKEDLKDAVRQLREALGLTQTRFADELGRGMSTVQRWEKVVPPRGKALADLYKLALNRGLNTLASAFHQALILELGASASYKLSGLQLRLNLIINALRNERSKPAERISWAIPELEEAVKELQDLDPFSMTSQSGDVSE